MAPSFNRGDFIIVKKFGFGNYGAYGVQLTKLDTIDLNLFKRGEVYAFISPLDNVLYSYRLIGFPGDTVEFVGEKIFINDKEIDSKVIGYIGDGIIYEETMGNKSYSVLVFPTSRQYEANKHLVPANSFFFVGDNRNRSKDSRYMGSISGHRIVGKVAYVFK